MTAPAELFTAAQIARALGCSKQNIHQRLASSPADDERSIGGNLTKLWRSQSLPAPIFDRLNEIKETHRCRTIADLLVDPPRRAPSQRVSMHRAISVARERGLDVLESAFETLGDIKQLSITQKDYLWTKACDELQLQTEAGEREKKIKRAILKVLIASGLLGADKETIRRNLNRQWKVYSSNGGKLTDRRATRDQRKRLPGEDRNKLIARTIDCGGRESQAFRELRDEGELSAETLARTISNPRRKSHMPASFRREITPEVNRLMPLHRGEKEHELRGPYVPQNYDSVAAGQAMQLDDVTLPVWFWEQDPESPNGIFFGRGQWILAIDLRSRMILGHALHSAPVYNMRIVRSLLLQIHDAYGLPEMLVLERGMWRTAKIIKGDELDISETEQGLREFGIRFQHRTKPRGKIIERVIGLVQNQMERTIGYVGRDERHDRFDRVQEQIRAVLAGRVHPSTHFLNKADWLQQLDKISLRYNRERQEGNLRSSPLESWNANLLPEKTVHLGSHARYLLAHHKKPIKVQPNGIRLAESLGGGLYYNEITGRFAGQRMLAWINPDELEAITLTSLDRRDGPYIVERAEALSAIDASDAELARAGAQISAHNGYARTQYRIIRDQLAARSFRPLLVDRATIELGEKIEAQSAAIRHERQKKARTVRTAQGAVRERGLNVRVDTKNAERAKVAADLIGEVYGDEANQ